MISLATDLNWSPQLTDFPEILIPCHREVYDHLRRSVFLLLNFSTSHHFMNTMNIKQRRNHYLNSVLVLIFLRFGVFDLRRLMSFCCQTLRRKLKHFLSRSAGMMVVDILPIDVKVCRLLLTIISLKIGTFYVFDKLIQSSPCQATLILSSINYHGLTELSVFDVARSNTNFRFCAPHIRFTKQT